jgi:hypothetical protein
MKHDPRGEVQSSYGCRPDLLLCGHHYRVSRKSLAAAGATVLDLNGEPVGDDVWPSVAA